MRIASFCLVLALAGGCSSGSFEVAPTAGDASVDSNAPPDDGATPDTTTGDGGDETPPPACDPAAVPDDAMGVFASPVGSDASGDGTRLKPYKSIAVAMKAARGIGRSRVFLDVGTYAEAVTFADATPGIFVEGGWKATGASWTRNCAAGARAQTVIAAPTAVAIFADAVTHRSGVRSLTIATKSKGATVPDASGESVIGVFVRGDGSQFALDDVEVVAGSAGDGGAASGGAAGAPIACTGYVCSAIAVGTHGAHGTAGPNGGAAKIPGSFGFSGFVPADGAAGTKGGNGAPGGPGGAGATRSCVGSCTGEGGVCGGFCGVIWTNRTGDTGKCGCPGGGGGFGKPGRGGGASVALLVVGDAQVDVTRSRLVAGNGGNGSPGGAGAEGATGAVGSGGASVACDTNCGRSPSCACVGVDQVTLAGGAPGGTGGTGGRGGNGGGGAGGPSYTIVAVSAAKVVVSDTALSYGNGGTAPDGAVIGTSGERFP